jgi:hypothetical protein
MAIALNPRRAWAAALGVVALIACGFASGLVAPRGLRVRGPSLRLDPTSKDLGVVPLGVDTSASFTLTNVGGSDLRLANLRTSCGCTLANLSTEVISPGSTATVAVTLRIPMHPGAVAQTITFETNDPEHAAERLGVRAQARWAVEANPPAIFVGSIPPGGTVTRDVELFSPLGRAFEITGFQAPPRVAVEAIKESGRPGHRYRVTVQGASTPGAFGAAVQFATSCPERAQVSVPFGGEVVGQKVTPKMLVLEPAPVGSIVNARCFVTSYTKTLPEIDGVEVEGDAWEVVRWAATRVKDRAVRLTIALRVPQSPGYQQCTLLLSELRSGFPLEIPTSCMITAGTDGAAIGGGAEKGVSPTP